MRTFKKDEKLSDILLPLFNEQGMSAREVAKKFKVNRTTVFNWIKKLREAGYEVKTLPVGNPKQEI